MRFKVRSLKETVNSSHLFDSATATPLAGANNSSSCGDMGVKISQVNI
ncbi:MAG: hypothetical protein WBA93_35635 [Microcoleaceae cyanobacterium]